MAKVIWTLTDEEKDTIEMLFEKKNAIENLFKIMDASNEELYKKLMNDYSIVNHEFRQWFQDMSEQYKWEGKNWEINFVTKEVILPEA